MSERILDVIGQGDEQLARTGHEVPAVPARKTSEEDAESRQARDRTDERPAAGAAEAALDEAVDQPERQDPAASGAPPRLDPTSRRCPWLRGVRG